MTHSDQTALVSAEATRSAIISANAGFESDFLSGSILPHNASLLDAALTYAKRGWLVFPCGADKKPLTQHGVKDATLNEGQIRRWWQANPTANVAIACGQGSGIFVVDCDNPPFGEREFKEFCAQHGFDPNKTLTAQTPSGGAHHLFRYPEGADLKNGVRGVFEHLDVRSTGGYILAAPSQTIKGSYAWVNDCEPLALPLWLADLYRRDHAPRQREMSPLTPGHGTTNYGAVALREEAERLATSPQGERNHTLNETAFRLFSLVAANEIAEMDAQTALEEAAAACGLPQAEAMRTLASARRAGMANPATRTEAPASANRQGSTTNLSSKDTEPSTKSDGQQEVQRPLAALNLDDFSGTLFCSTMPPSYRYLLDKSLGQGDLGALIGPPGAGKGQFSIQMCSAVAAGLPVLGTWRPVEAARAMFLSAEDPPDVLHRRVYHTIKMLPEQYRGTAAENIRAVSVRGQVFLCVGRGNDVYKTPHFHDLRALVGSFKPKLLVLDTLARFCGVDTDIDNLGVTTACSFIEELCAEFDCTIIILHHTHKGAGALAKDSTALAAALEQTASRGATGLTGAVRWQMNLAPLAAGFATKTLGEDAIGRPDGSCLAVRVSKKNYGPPEPHYFLARGEQGILRRIEPIGLEQKKDASIEDDARDIAEEVRRRAGMGLDPLPASTGGRLAFGWGDMRNQRATAAAIDGGLVTRKKRDKGKGEILVEKIPEKIPEQENPANPGENPERDLL